MSGNGSARQICSCGRSRVELGCDLCAYCRSDYEERQMPREQEATRPTMSSCASSAREMGSDSLVSFPAEAHNAFAPKLTEPIPADAQLCPDHGWYFAVRNFGGSLVCRECMLEDGACALYTPGDV